MKKILLSGLLIAGLGAVAQTPRLSLYEEFTGETCPPCAATNPGLNILLASPTNTPKVVAIKWQVPIPSAPSAAWSLYQTNKVEIDWRWKSGAGNYGYSPAINSAPSSKIDGQEATVFGAASGHPANLNNNVISTAQSYTSAFSVTMNRAWDPTFSAVNLTINITASANFTAVGALIFRTVMVEKHIHFATQPGTNGEKDFDDVAIASFPTLQAGVPMSGTWTTGQTQTFTLNCALPTYVRDKSEVAFVGFIQDDGSQKVAQAVRADPQGVTNDAKAIAVNIPVTCNTNLAPQITVNNNGSNIITSFNVNPFMNGVAGTVYNWSGSLAPGASTNIALSSMAVINGMNTFSYTISNVSSSDNNLANNATSVKFRAVLNYQTSPVAEGFVGTAFPPTNFSTYNNYAGTTWIRSTAAGGFGTSTQSTKLDFYSGVPDQSVNELNLPAMHTGTIAPILWFDVAYAQYTSENDQLDVMISDDCGLTWSNVYSESGTNLSTAPAQTAAFTPNATQWRTETINLGAAYANKDVLVKFVGTSDYGNNLYVDNINLKSCVNQTVTVSSNDNVICMGETATLTASGASSYSWSTSQTGATQVVSPAGTETYVVTNTDPNGCVMNSASIVLTVLECTGISHLSAADLQVSVYPNPSNGETSIRIAASTGVKATISVVNTLGQVVFKKETTLNNGSNSVNLDVKEFASGVYNVVIDTDNGTTTKKLTVSK